MKKYYLFIIPLLGFLTLGGIGIASAHGGWGMTGTVLDPQIFSQHWSEKISQQATVLDITIDEMKSYWSQGKTLWDIAKEKGISDANLQARLKAQHEEQLKKSLQVLVDKGLITQAQADARLKVIQDASFKFSSGKIGKHGMMRMMW